MQKQDIFAPQQAPQQGMPGQTAPGQSETVKTSTEGDLTGSQSSGSSQSSEGIPADTKANDQRVVRQNKMSVPNFATKAEADLGAAEKGLQDEANKYTQDAAAKSYKLGDSDLEAALSGNQDAYGKATNLLTGTSKERATGFDTKNDYKVKDIDALKTDAGVESLLRRDAGSQYNAGESAFDRMLLGRSPEFNQIRSSLGQRQDALTKNLDDYRTSKTAEAQAAMDKNYADAQEEAKGYLGRQAEALRAAQQKELADENAARAALRQGGNAGYISEQSKAALEALMRDYQGTPEAQYIGQNASIDPKGYYHVAEDLADYGGLVDQNEAARFNTINALLGRGGNANWSAGTGAGPRESFDAAGYANTLKSAANESRIQADTKARTDAAAKKAKDDANAQLLEQQKAAAAAAAKQAEEEALAARPEYESAMYESGDGPKKPYKKTGGLIPYAGGQISKEYKKLKI